MFSFGIVDSRRALHASCCGHEEEELGGGEDERVRNEAAAAASSPSPSTSAVAGPAVAAGWAAIASGKAPPTTVAVQTQTQSEDTAAVRGAGEAAPGADARHQARDLTAPIPSPSASAATATPNERPGPHCSRGPTPGLGKSRPTPPSPCVVPLYPPGIPQRDGGGYRAPARDVAHSPQGKANERTGHLRRGEQRDRAMKQAPGAATPRRSTTAAAKGGSRAPWRGGARVLSICAQRASFLHQVSRSASTRMGGKAMEAVQQGTTMAVERKKNSTFLRE